MFGVGPGLGQAVARRYARDGYTVITADLSNTNSIPALAGQIRARVGNLDAFYHAPTPDGGFVPAAGLTPQLAKDFMPLSFYTLLALVQEFLSHMLEQGAGAILTAQGVSSVHGLLHMSGPRPAQAAQRNYLQSLYAEGAGKGVYVGMLYIGAAIKSSAFHTEMEKARSAGGPVWEIPPPTPFILPRCSGKCITKKSRPKLSTFRNYSTTEKFIWARVLSVATPTLI